MMRVRNADPPSTVGGLEGIDKRVGSRGKKKAKAKGCSWVYFPLEAIHNLASEVGLKPSPGFSSSRVT